MKYKTTCCKCGIKTTFKNSYGDMRRFSGLATICKECSKKYSRKWYKNNISETKAIRKNLVCNGCCICGYNKCDSALEFHHVSSEDKKFHLNLTNIRYKPTKDLVKEINKCVLLCANCHREVHHKEE